MNTTHMSGAHRSQKIEHFYLLTAITNGCEPLCGCSELNLGPLPEQVLFTVEHIFVIRSKIAVRGS